MMASSEALAMMSPHFFCMNNVYWTLVSQHRFRLSLRLSGEPLIRCKLQRCSEGELLRELHCADGVSVLKRREILLSRRLFLLERQINWDFLHTSFELPSCRHSLDGRPVCQNLHTVCGWALYRRECEEFSNKKGFGYQKVFLRTGSFQKQARSTSAREIAKTMH